MLASLEIARRHPESQLTCYTLGCPRVGGWQAGWVGGVAAVCAALQALRLTLPGLRQPRMVHSASCGA